MATGFLTLPPEIRIKIYLLVFRDTIITIHALKDPQPGPPEHDWASDERQTLQTQVENELERSRLGRSKVALLSLSRQIRCEALPLFMPNVIVNLHVGAVMWVTSKTEREITRLFNAMFRTCPVIARIERLAFFIESMDLFRPYLSHLHSLREVYAWDWKRLCVTEIEYFSEVGCGSTRHEEYNRRMAEVLFDKLVSARGGKAWKTYFQHSVCDSMDDVLEIGTERGHFQHQVIPRGRGIISHDDMDVENLTAYPLR